MPLFLCLFFIFCNIHTFIHSITFIDYIYPLPFAEASLHFLITCLLSGETPPCGAEPRIELGPALQQADALPTEPRRTLTETRRAILCYPTDFVLNSRQAFRIWIWVMSAFSRVSDPDPHESALIWVAGSGSGSRRAKMTHKNRKKVQNFHVL